MKHSYILWVKKTWFNNKHILKFEKKHYKIFKLYIVIILKAANSDIFLINSIIYAYMRRAWLTQQRARPTRQGSSNRILPLTQNLK